MYIPEAECSSVLDCVTKKINITSYQLYSRVVQLNVFLLSKQNITLATRTDEPKQTKMGGLPEFPDFDVTDISNAGPRWKKHTTRFKNLCVAMDLKAEAVERKKALFLHYVGPAVYDIYDTLKAEGDKYKEVRQKLDDYFIPKCNADFERHVFRKTLQLEGM